MRPSPAATALGKRSAAAEDIEPFEDGHPAAEDDPIEPSPTQPDGGATFLTPIVRQPGTSRLMKDRAGRIRSPDELPQLASQLRAKVKGQAAQQASKSPQQDTQKDDPTAPEAQASPEPADESSRSPVPPPSTAPASKRRGRPPLPPEEKARRAAEKERIAAEKKAQKAEIAAQKKAAANPGKGRKSLQVHGLSASPTVEPHQDVPQTPAAAPARIEKDAPESIKWTTLPEAPAEVDVTMIDELQSSSPPPPPPEARFDGSQTPMPSTSQKQPVVSSRPNTQSSLVTPLNKLLGKPLLLENSSQAEASEPPARHLSQDSPAYAIPSTQGQTQNNLHSKTPRTASQPFPKLSEIHSQRMYSAFAGVSVPSSQRSPLSRKKGARLWQQDNDSDSDSSSSEAEEEAESHVPKDRRAGVQK